MIHVEIFSDRVEIESPGRFPGLFSESDPLSARIARVAADQQFGQELGEGIRRMFEEMRLAGLADPLYEQTQGSVRLTLSAEPVDRELEARLPRDTRLLIAALRDAGELSTGEVAEAVGVSRITASERLKKLRDAGLAEWTKVAEGSTRVMKASVDMKLGSGGTRRAGAPRGQPDVALWAASAATTK